MTSIPLPSQRPTGPFTVLQRVSVGVLCGLVTAVFSLSFAALLFSGAFADSIGIGMGVMLTSSAIFTIATAVLTSFPPTYSQVRDIPIAYLALVALPLAAATSAAATLPTLIAFVALTTLAIGVAFFAVGQAKLGRMARFVPFPVVSGFLAGVAWLIITGALAILTGRPFELGSIAELFDGDVLPKLIATATFVLVGAVGRRWLPSGILIPVLVLAATLVFHLWTALSSAPAAFWEETRWVAQLPEGATLWPPIKASDLSLIDWGAIGGQWFTIAVIVPVAMIALLLNISGLETEAKRDIDLDAELKTAGVANILSAFAGGAPGYQSLSMTLMSQRLGGGTRLTSIAAGLFLLVVVVFGSELIALVPLPALAGIVLATGSALLWERLVGSFRRLAPAEYLVVLAIFVATVGLGFLVAVIFGIVAAMALFVIDYSRSGVVKLEMTGRDYQSGAESSDARRHVLQIHGGVILILRLQGFLFFGTANGLRRTIERRLQAASGRDAARFVLLDFRRISGVDSAAVESFTRLGQTAADRGVRIVVANVQQAVLRTLLRGGLVIDGGSAIQIAENFDQALHDIEDEVLAGIDPKLTVRLPQPISGQLRLLAGDSGQIEELVGFFERAVFPRGIPLVVEGSAANDLYFIEAGTASVGITAGSSHVTLTKVGPGSIVGEISFYLGSPRTASVVAEVDVTAWRFTKESLARMEAISPQIASRFHAGMAELLADRLAATNRLVRFLAT